MKKLESIIKIHKWNLDEKKSHLQDLHNLYQELLKQLDNIEEELEKEQQVLKEASGDIKHFEDYYAGVRARRKKVQNSLFDLEKQIKGAEDQVTSAFQDLKRYETVNENQINREKKEERVQEQKEMDEIANLPKI